MPTSDPTDELCDKLFEAWAARALTTLATSLRAYSEGKKEAQAAHSCVIAYGLECERVLRRITEAQKSNPNGLLRDALDAGVLTLQEASQLLGRDPMDVPPAATLAPLPKRKWVERSLQAGPVLIHLDATAHGVDVPAWLRSPELVLRFGYELRPPIFDLQIDDTGIRGTLTFKGVPHCCKIPWDAVRATVLDGTNDVQFWDAAEPLTERPDDPPAPKTPHLRLV